MCCFYEIMHFIFNKNQINNKNVAKFGDKYYKLLSKYESILHQHEFMLMFNSENIDLHLFLNQISNINMDSDYVISILMKIYGVHPKRQNIIKEMLKTKFFLNKTNCQKNIQEIILQQIFLTP